MKSETLKIGTKFGTELAQFEVSVKVAESVTDMNRLAAHDRSEGRMTGSEMDARDAFVVQMFNRGWRIWSQEQSGARDIVKSSSVADRKDAEAMKVKLQSCVDSADPLAPAKRTGRPAKPAEVTLTADAQKAMQSGDMAALTALLAAQGIKVNIAQ